MPDLNKRYSVSQLSKIAGVSVRTLHHYDEVGLLVARRADNGYRQYSAHDAACLQQILIYRALDMPLEQIKAIMTAENYDLLDALQKQRSLLLQRQSETKSILNRVEATMSVIKGEKNIDIMFEEFPANKAKEWKTQLINSESNGDLILEAYGQLSATEMTEETKLSHLWAIKYVELLTQPTDSTEVQSLIKEAYVLSNRMCYKAAGEGKFNGLTYDIYLQMADATINDPVMTEMYNHYDPKFAQHVHKAMLHFAEHELKEKENEYLGLTVLDS